MDLIMNFNMVDIIIVGLMLFLAMKGFFNGFTQELFNFIALIGGVIVAARVNTMVGEKFAELNLLPNITSEVQNFIGFLLTLIVVWLVISFISSIIGKISSDAPGFISRFLGYIIGLVRYVAIFSLIIFGISKADFLRENLIKHYKDSQLFMPMSNLGAKLLDVENNSTLAFNENNTSELNITKTIDENNSN